MKFLGLFLFFYFFNSCQLDSKNQVGFTSDSKRKENQSIQVNHPDDTVIHLQGADIFLVDDSITVKNTFISGSITNNIIITPNEGMLEIHSGSFDTVVKGNVVSYSSIYSVRLFSGFDYAINNGILFCKNRLGEFKLIDYSWIPVTGTFKKVTLVEEIEIGRESIQFGSDFFTLFRISKIKSSEKDLRFLESSFVAIAPSKKFKKQTVKNVEIDLYSMPQQSQGTNYKYSGLILK